MKKLKIYSDKTGQLVPISLKDNIPFKTKRIFVIHGKKNLLEQIMLITDVLNLIPLSGTMTINFENKKGKFKKILSFKKNNVLLLKAKSWCKIKFHTSNSKLMVFCDMEYDPTDYIRNYKNFLTLIGK